MSVKQGKKYDDPASAAEIPGFINFHQLNMNEVLLPVEEFKTFNEFFYRALKPDARPCSAPNDPEIITSPADCRSVVFNQISQAQKIWVKGREFNMQRLLGNAYPEDVKRFDGGALGIFRLAPQDYHRFHIPVDGIMGEPKLIEGEYYTVNPMAIRSALDVYGENVRICVPIDSATHGRVMVICVGAMMVGSTVITAKAGDHVSRADELGYFKFGGSTILLLFEPGVMEWDDDLVENSNQALETLVSGVGRRSSAEGLLLIALFRFALACQSDTAWAMHLTCPTCARTTPRWRRDKRRRDASKAASRRLQGTALAWLRTCNKGRSVLGFFSVSEGWLQYSRRMYAYGRRRRLLALYSERWMDAAGGGKLERSFHLFRCRCPHEVTMTRIQIAWAAFQHSCKMSCAS